jgi:hypothetical protein
MSILSAFKSLTDLANTYQSDKGTAHFERHGYTEVYERLFRRRKWSRLTLLEVGLRHDPYYGAQVPPLSPSLQMWRDYFPRALICGFDINDFTHMNAGRVRIFVGDQGDEATLKQVLEVVPAFDVIIDDGSHASFHQATTLRTLLGAVKPNGLYFIEDLHWQPEALEQTLPPTPPMREQLKDPHALSQLGIDPAQVEFFAEEKLVAIRR